MEGETQDQSIVWTSDLELKLLMIRKAKAPNLKKEYKNNKKSSSRSSMLNIKRREINQHTNSPKKVVKQLIS